MLDEILEYQQYTEDPALIENPRLKYCNLKDGLKGLKRPLLIVARGFMNREFADLTPEEKFEKTKVVLRQWCGAYEPKDGEEDYGLSVQNWFPLYIEDCLIPKAEKTSVRETLKKILRDFPKKYDSFDHTEFWIIKSETDKKDKTKKNTNNENQITYERAIHEAGRMGELERYYLASRKILKKQDLIKQTAKGGGHPKDSHIDLILKVISAYLLENSEWDSADLMRCRYAQICWADIVNWSMGTFSDGASLLTKYYWGRRPVFEREPFRYQRNYTKFRLSRGFMDAYRWQLVREADLPEFLDTHPGYAVYRDEGTGVPFTQFTAGEDPIEEICGFKQA